MSVAVGTRLGAYEITAKLGEGGMGEVYRATDTKLKRDVAIKVLPQGFTEDKERLARFEREAQLLAQLNHPNIAAIYALEKWGQLPISDLGPGAPSAAGKSETVPISARRLVPRGRPVALEQEMATTVGAGSAQLAISRRGTAVWITGAAQGSVGAPLWFARDGSSVPASIQMGVDVLQLALSPDGRRVALRGGASTVSEFDLWVGDLERGTVTRLTFDERADFPTWTPDSRRIAYYRTGAGDAGVQIAWRAADGSDDPAVLFSEPGEVVSPVSFSPDGRELVFRRRSAQGLTDFWILGIDPKSEPRPLLETPHEEYSAAVSPDGRWLAYDSGETGRGEVFVRPFRTGSGRWQVSTASGLEPRWSADGRELFYRDEGGRLYRVAIDSGDSFRASPPELMFGGLLGGRNPRSYDVTPDGLVSGRMIGRTREVRLNPAYFARVELAAYLARLADAELELRQRTQTLRRRPRQAGKPL